MAMASCSQLAIAIASSTPYAHMHMVVYLCHCLFVIEKSGT